VTCCTGVAHDAAGKGADVLRLQCDQVRTPSKPAERLQLAELLDFRPDLGVIRLHDERVVILSAAAMGLLQKSLIDTFGRDVARRLMLRFGYADGYHECGQHVSAALSQPYYLDVTHPQANKGEVVAALSTLLAIPIAHIATIGDMPNDVLMFERSGLSIAMANASAEVQRAATFVTASNTEEGFALAMERFVLGARAVH